MTDRELLDRAIAARKNAYTPYSHFQVGAALLAADGTVYPGCNLENAAFSPTICAERAAIASAVSRGVREFTAIAIVGGREGEGLSPHCAPCGVCRQVLAEFCTPDARVILGDEAHLEVYALSDLLPLSFTRKSME